VTKTCLQCGAVLPSSARACHFCDSSFSVGPSIWEDPSGTPARENLIAHANSVLAGTDRYQQSALVSPPTEGDAGWQGELAQRLDAYRTRRRRLAPNAAQSQFSFDSPADKIPAHAPAAVAEPPASVEEDFSFTIAIGRPSKKRVLEESRVVIDVSQPPGSETNSQSRLNEEARAFPPGLHPVASIDDRRLAALIDFCCLLFAYGSFLVLFASLGGQFTVSKLNAAVHATTFAIVYLQYFALFTVFGGTTPGMMFRGLQVASFSGEHPTPRQMLLRSLGYLISASTFFLGFFWAVWDEDALTWHDRISHTYLSSPEKRAHASSASVAASR
jgi:uncharacterized RDD family membrane protein YckC